MTDYQRTLHSQMPMEKLYENVERFFTSRGYAIKNQNFPHQIDLKKKGSFIAIHDINSTYYLKITFTPIDHSTSIYLYYTFPQCAGSLTSKSVRQLNNEADSLGMIISQTIPKKATSHPEVSKPISQPAINIHVGKIGDDRVSVKDSVVQRSSIGGTSQKKISICPYCGEELNFPETPRYCPYCRKQILM